MKFKFIIKVIITLLFVAVFTPLTYRIGDYMIYTFDVFLLPLLLVTLLDVSFNKRFYFKFNYPEKLFIIFFIFVILSNILSINKVASFNELFMWLRISILYFILRYSLRNRILIEKDFIKFIKVVFVFLILIGYIQIVTNSSFGLVANYFGNNLDQGGIFLESVRISGTTSNSNVYGAWLVFLATPILLKYSMQGKNIQTNTLLVILTPLLLSTLSKATVIYYIITMILIFWLIATSDKKSLKKLSRNFAIIVIIVLPLLLLFFTSQLGSDFINNAYERFTITLGNDLRGTSTRTSSFISFFNLLHEHFFRYLFVGQGMSVYYETLEYLEIPHNVFKDYINASSERSGLHNIVMNFTASFGILPTCLFIYFYYVEIKYSRRLINLDKNYISYSLYILLVGLIFFSQVNTITWSVNLMPLCALVFAVINNQYYINRGRGSEKSYLCN